MSTMNNSVMLIGRSDRNVYESDGKVEFNLLVTEKIQDSKTREWKSSTQSVRCVCATIKYSYLRWMAEFNEKNGLRSTVDLSSTRTPSVKLPFKIFS